jgi:superfamily I DNA/RNA helicase
MCARPYKAVRLMTLHASKGLEFNSVFIVGCEDGLIPSRRDGAEVLDDEEVGLARYCPPRHPSHP